MNALSSSSRIAIALGLVVAAATGIGCSAAPGVRPVPRRPETGWVWTRGQGWQIPIGWVAPTLAGPRIQETAADAPTGTTSWTDCGDSGSWSSPATPSGCQRDSDGGSGSMCESGACVADMRCASHGCDAR